MFQITKKYHISYSELENMTPFEYEILTLYIQEDIKKEMEMAEKLKQQREKSRVR
jgi:hypothetical protein